MITSRIYYYLKPMIPRRLQIIFRRKIVHLRRVLNKNIWPIDEKAGQLPEGWTGWPNKKRFALVLTHDVDTAIGHGKCRKLMDMEKNAGFRSSFNFVPERYDVSSSLRHEIRDSGFEVGVHGLKHDGKLYNTETIFVERSERINYYLKLWKCVGFRSPAMHHNLEWIHKLEIEYDMSTFDTDPFEPQSDGLGTIFPFWVEDRGKQGYVELPYTLPQDFTLFILMRERDINIWKEKLDWIAEKGGMALLNTHPDYMNFSDKKNKLEEYSANLYIEFIEYVFRKYKGQYWHVLPGEMARFWRENMGSRNSNI